MLNGKELLDNNTHIIYEKITTDELPLKVIEVTLAKDDPNLIPPKHWHRSLEFIKMCIRDSMFPYNNLILRDQLADHKLYSQHFLYIRAP